MELLRKYSIRNFLRHIKTFFVLCSICFFTSLSSVFAVPEGAQVVNGQVSFQQNGYNTTITASDKAIINYSSFDIAHPEIVQFVQPNSSASVLNRIQSGNPTNINGTLLANGRIFFVNPAGVIFGAGAKVNVNQLVASSLNITNSDFINGQYNFAGGNGSVINRGDITAEKVYLIGKQVVNSGNIHCPDGYVVMAAGDKVFLSEPGSNVRVEIDPQTSSEQNDLVSSVAEVTKEEKKDAAGDRIILASGDLFSQALTNIDSLAATVETSNTGKISNSGTVEAKSDNMSGGTVIAKATGIINTGTVDVTGGEGGDVIMEATERLGQFGKIHADGNVGNGGNIELRADNAVALSSDSLTTANAATNGDGGEVIVYSPDTALFHEGAKIEAKGGREIGDGGFVEVSGKEHVEVFGLADMSANNGDGGTFFIDPHNVTIKDDAGTLDGGGNLFAASRVGDTVSDDAIESVINTGSAAIIETSGGGLEEGDIIQDDDATIDFTGAGGNASLTLNASDDVELNGGVAVSGETEKLNVTINANGDYDTASKEGDVDINADIATNGGDFISSGIDFDNTGGVITTGGGKVDIQNTGDVKIGAEINTGEGDVSINGGSVAARNIISSGGIIISSGTTNLEASGNIGENGATIETASTGTINARSIVAGDIYIDNTGAVTLGTVSTASSDIVINNSDNMSVDSITVGGDGDVTLISTGDITTKTLSTTNGDISVQSTSGDLIFNGAVTSSGGRITLEGWSHITTNALKTKTGDIDVHSNTGNLISNGPVTSSGGEIKLKNDSGNIEAQILTAETGDIYVELNSGDLFLYGPVTSGGGITLKNHSGNIGAYDLTAKTGDIEVLSTSSGSIILSEPVTSGGGITLQNEYGNIYTQKLKAEIGNIKVWSRSGNLILSDSVSSEEGGVSLVSSNGNIYTPTLGKKDATLNVPITGYSDGTKGVDLYNFPFIFPGDAGKAAIVIKSQDDLKLGPGAKLTAKGNYIGFSIIDELNIWGRIWQVTSYAGSTDPFDVAIYVNSQGGNVTVGSPFKFDPSETDPGGTILVDAWNEIELGPLFKDSWRKNNRKNRLDVCSQITRTLDEAKILGTLPHVYEAYGGRAPWWFNGSKYVLRGTGGVILTILEPVPLPSSPPLWHPLPLQIDEELDTEELMLWLEQEGIAPYFEGAHPEMLSTDLRLYKATKKIRDYAIILKETTSEQIEQLIETLLYIVDHPVPLDSSIDWFHKRLQAIRPPDEALYAMRGVEWIDALIGYARILNTEFGWPVEKCVEKAMRDYIIRLKTDDHRFFIKEYLRRSLVADTNDENVHANLIGSN